MGMGAAHKISMGEALEGQIIDILATPGDQFYILFAPDRLTNPEFHLLCCWCFRHRFTGDCGGFEAVHRRSSGRDWKFWPATATYGAMIDPFGRGHQLPAGFRHGPLRFSLRLLHARTHDLPSQGRCTVAGRARPVVRRLHPQGSEEAAPDRRRAPGPARCDEAVPLAWTPPRQR